MLRRPIIEIAGFLRQYALQGVKTQFGKLETNKLNDLLQNPKGEDLRVLWPQRKYKTQGMKSLKNFRKSAYV